MTERVKRIFEYNKAVASAPCVWGLFFPGEDGENLDAVFESEEAARYALDSYRRFRRLSNARVRKLELHTLEIAKLRWAPES